MSRKETIIRQENLAEFEKSEILSWIGDYGVEVEAKTKWHYWFKKNDVIIEVWPTTKKWRKVELYCFKNKTGVYKDLEKLLKKNLI